jgi:hypothetical protein
MIGSGTAIVLSPGAFGSRASRSSGAIVGGGVPHALAMARATTKQRDMARSYPTNHVLAAPAPSRNAGDTCAGRRGARSVD